MISLIHPSRNRPDIAFKAYVNWHSKASGDIQIEHILSLDADEPQKQRYIDLFTESVITMANPSDGYVVGATNEAAKLAKGDILIYLSDDFDCPHHWDKLITAHMDISKPQILRVDDCLQAFSVAVLTIPIMTKAYYDRFGYFFHPEYKSMFCDEDLYHCARIINALVFAPDLKFPHLHPSNPSKEMRANNDDTYSRSSAMWEQGKAVHNKRKSTNYGL